MKKRMKKITPHPAPLHPGYPDSDKIDKGF
jgi:hypothetical protein